MQLVFALVLAHAAGSSTWIKAVVEIASVRLVAASRTITRIAVGSRGAFCQVSFHTPSSPE
jgi:hypothetical protein